MIDEEIILAVAMAIEGPHKDVPATCKWTLDELRQIRWNNLTWQEHSFRMYEARAAIKAFTKATGKTT